MAKKMMMAAEETGCGAGLSEEQKEELRGMIFPADGTSVASARENNTSVPFVEISSDSDAPLEFLEDSATSPMILAKMKSGHIKSLGQFKIASLEALKVAAKPTDDSRIWNEWLELLQEVMSATEDGRFDSSRMFSDEDVAGVVRLGLRQDASEGRPELIADDSATVAEKRAYLEQKIVPGAARKVLLMLTRTTDSTPQLVEQMKPATAAALEELVEKAADILETAKA